MNEYNTGNSEGRISVRREYGGTVIEIAARKNWPMILFMTVWLCGWAVGEYFALQTLLSSDAPIYANAFIIFWLLGWTIGGGFAFYTVLRQLFGREILTVESGVLTLRRTVSGLGGKREFETGRIKNIMIIPDHAVGIRKMEGKKIPGRLGGRIKFDYDEKSIRFGMSLSTEEAATVVEGLRRSGWIRSMAFESEERNF